MRHIILLSVLILLVPYLVSAQFFTPEPDISLDIAPRTPEPGETITITLDAYTLDTTGASIKWFVNGLEQVADNNLRSIELTTPEIGEELTITVKLSTRRGQNMSVTEVIVPARIDLILEADTLVPVFYKGRPLPSSRSSVRVIAIPHVVSGATPKQFTYRWSLNNRTLFGGPLTGKNVVDIDLGTSRQQILTVAAIDQSGVVVARKSLAIPLTDPEVLFYEINPLRGLNRRALESPFTLTSNETTIQAEPYYLDTDVLNGNVLTEWSYNGREISNPSDNPLALTLQKTSELGGSASISFHIRNLDKLLQGVEEDLQVRY